MRDDLLRHFKLISTDKDPNIRKTHRKMHQDSYEKICGRYEDLCDANCVHAMYEYAHFLFCLDDWGIAPDFELSLEWYKKAASYSQLLRWIGYHPSMEMKTWPLIMVFV